MLRQVVSTGDSGRRLVKREAVGALACVVQASRLMVPHLSIDQPAIILVRQGMKRVSGHGTRLAFAPGTVAVFSGGRNYDVLNEPTGAQPYVADALLPDPGLMPGLPRPGTRPVSGVALMPRLPDGFMAAFDVAAAAIADRNLPETVARHRVAELLLWLEAAGLSLVAPREADLALRLRTMIARDPASDWTSGQAARAMALSEATLRRRLAQAGTSLSAIVLDVRLSTALALLQSTDEPVTQIALSVGYESPSRFAARFRERFGFRPSLVRAAED